MVLFPHQIKVEEVWNFINQLIFHIVCINTVVLLQLIIYCLLLQSFFRQNIHLCQLGVCPDKDQITLQFKMSTAILTFAQNEDVVVLWGLWLKVLSTIWIMPYVLGSTERKWKWLAAIRRCAASCKIRP